MRSTHCKEEVLGAVHAHRHPQLDRRRAGLDRAVRAQLIAHRHGARACSFGVSVAVEQEQQRVSAELQQAAALVVGDGEQTLEAASDRVGQLLRALAAAPPCEALGQLGETGHVDEHAGAVDGAHAALSLAGQELQHRARYVRFGPDGRHARTLRAGRAPISRRRRSGAPASRGSA
jgi:hypothetical protein